MQKHEDIASNVTSRLKELATNITVAPPNRLLITVDSPKLKETARKLAELGFDHVKAVTGVDYPQENKIDLIYHVSSYENLELARIILEIRTLLNRADPRISSLSDVWPSAEYSERETADLLGVVFEGLQMSGRFLLPESFQGSPLRKDFKIKTEGIDA